MKADYVDKLYGVPREDKRWIREEINRAAAHAERNVVPLREPLPSPEELLFGATQEAEKYGFRQRGDYFFHQNIPYLIMDKIADRLEDILPTIDVSPTTVDRIRDEVMRYVNFVARGSEGDLEQGEIPASCLVRNLEGLVDSLVRSPGNLPNFDWSVFSVIRDITHLLESTERQARILPFRK